MSKFWLINPVSIAGVKHLPGSEVDDTVQNAADFTNAGAYLFAQGNATVDAAAATAQNAHKNRGANEFDLELIMQGAVDSIQGTGLSTSAGQPVGFVAGAGSSTAASKSDHVHPMGAWFAGSRAARGVVFANVAALAAFTVAGNDGLTYVAGDRVLLANQTTPAECGLYVVGAVGGGTAPLTRAADMPAAAAIVNGMTVEVSEGTIFAGSTWKALCTGAAVVGTNDPVFYPRRVGGTVTLVAGAYTLGSADGLFLFSTTKTPIQVTRNTANTSTATTGGYQAPVASRTAGKSGTAAALIQAAVAAGTLNNADVSSVDWSAVNW